MEINKYIATLKTRVSIDRNIRNNSTETDYEKFCEEECIAIEKVLDRLEEMTALAIHYEKELKKLTTKYYELRGEVK